MHTSEIDSLDFSHQSLLRSRYDERRLPAGRWPDSAPGLEPFDDQGRVRTEIVAYIYSYVTIVVIVLLQVVVAGLAPTRPAPRRSLSPER